MPFNEILGHDRAIGWLMAAVENDRLAHAYLFDGPPGVGKKLVALSLAKALHCADAGPTDFCGTCRSCRRIRNGNHANVWVFDPDPKRKMFTLDRIGRLHEELAMRSGEPGARVFILDGAEMMNEEVQNRLLKTLEEPADDALLVLVATHPERLSLTIRSRVQRVRFSGLPPEMVRETLLAQRRLSDTQAQEIARLSDGSLGRAFDLVDSDTLQTARIWIETFLQLQNLDASDAAAVLVDTVGVGASKRAQGRRRLSDLLGIVFAFWRDVHALQLSQDAPPLLATFAQESRAYAARLDGRSVLKLLDTIRRTREDLAFNAQGTIAMMDLAIRCRRILRAEHVAIPVYRISA